MKKKLNKKLRFALATLGAFAVCGVSAYSALEELNHEPMQAYAIDTPTDGNPVEDGLFTFSKVGSNSYIVAYSFEVIVGDSASAFNFDQYRIQFKDSAQTGDKGTTNWVGTPSVVDGKIHFESPGVVVNSPNFTDISSYWVMHFSNTTVISVWVECNFVDYDTFTIDLVEGANVYALSPVLPAPTPVDYVHEIVGILTAGIVNLGNGIGQGISSFVQSLAFNSAGDGLSVYFVMVCVFGGIALAVGLTTKIFMWLSNLGS